MEQPITIKSQIISVMRYLRDPYLVSGFQSRFGVVNIKSTQNGHKDSFKHGIVNGVQTGHLTMHGNHLVQDTENKTPYIVKKLMWYYIFSFGKSLGYEMFYATFFPFWTWNLDSAVCRKVVNVWVVVMYVGQALKDIIRWPRPSSPPVVHMEPKYVVEYGMPSTHAMVGVALPFSFLYFTYKQYEYPVLVGLLIAVAWCILVCCSRLYMGMHTVLDVIGGLLLAPILMILFLPFSEVIDYFQQRSTYSPPVTIAVMIFLQIMYPKTTHWTPARGDTSVIMGTGTGLAFGTWLNYQLGIVHGPYLPTPYHISFPNLEMIIMSLVRTFVGLLCIIIARLVFKTVVLFIVCNIMRLDYRDAMSRRKPIVEIPTKFITYIIIGFVIMYFAPFVFRIIGIERKNMHVEI